MAGLRLLHKSDSVGRGYTVVGFGGACVPQMLALALAMHSAAATINARAAAAAAAAASVTGEAGTGAPEWRLRIGIAWGGAVSGSLGAQRRRCHFFGGAVAEAVRLLRDCPQGETRVQRRLARAAGAQAFAFSTVAAPAAVSWAARGPADALGLVGRRRHR